MNDQPLIDASVSISEDMSVWPGDPRVQLERVSSIEDGAACNVTLASFTVHAGTHLDAPCHFIRDGFGVDAIALDVLIGRAYVLDLGDHHGAIHQADIDRAPECERLVLRTGNTRRGLMRSREFHTDYAHLAEDAAELIVRRSIRLVGIDYLSVEGFNAPSHAVHDILLGNEVIAVEGLDLTEVDEGWWKLICLPTKLKGSDGSPARVVFRRED